MSFIGVLLVACTTEEILIGSNGYFSSPNFPDSYPPYSRCTWNIKVPSGYIIKVSFLYFKLDPQPKSDRATITNVASDDSTYPFQLYGQSLPDPVYSKGVDIGEGFWHISTCPTFNRKFKLKIINFHLQPLLAEC